jgi:O-antigen ligase
MMKIEVRKLKEDPSFLAYCFFTLFMIYFSTSAIQAWPNLWAQITISVACILPVLMVLAKNVSHIAQIKEWPIEIKFVLIIIALGILNVYFSEDRHASLKGMGLFLMSGVMVFSFTFFTFRSKLRQLIFLYLCTICFFTLIIFGLFEFAQQINYPGKRILLFSSNPIPAGSLLILLSSGPIMLFAQTETRWGKNALLLCLIVAALIIILIGQRGPILAILIMASIWAAQRNKRFGIFSLIILILLGIGYQFRDQIPIQYKTQLFKTETVLVRLEFYNVAWQVIKDKPFFGLGFNAPLNRYISQDYQPKFYPANRTPSFYSIIRGVETFDNMALFFLGGMGVLFTLAYSGLAVYLLKPLILPGKANTKTRNQSILLLLVLVGFFVHSMTYDSLRYPHLNWIFHSLLGLIANQHASPSKNL